MNDFLAWTHHVCSIWRSGSWVIVWNIYMYVDIRVTTIAYILFQCKKTTTFSIKKVWQIHIYLYYLEEIFILIPFAPWSATLLKKTEKLTRSSFFATRRHFSKLVLQINSEIVRITLENSLIERFVRKQLFENTIVLLQNNWIQN